MSQRTPRGGIEAVSAAILAMNRQLEVREVLQTIVASARELLGAEYAALGVPDDHGGFAQFVVDGVSDAQWKAIGPLPRQHGVLAAMLQQATPQRLADVRDFESFAGWPRAHPVMKDFIGMPVVDGDEILGAVFLANKVCPRQPDAVCGFTQEDEDLLRILADHAAIALTNAQLLRAQPRADAGRRAGPDRPRTARRRLAEAVLPAAHRAGGRRPGRRRTRPRQGGAAAGRRARRRGRRRAAGRRGRTAARGPGRGRPRRHAAHPGRRPGPGALRGRHLPRLPGPGPARRPGGGAAAGRPGGHPQRAAPRRTPARSTSPSKAAARAPGCASATTAAASTPPWSAGPAAISGLVSMRDRADGVGGRLTVTSEPGKGTVIEMEVPGG